MPGPYHQLCSHLDFQKNNGYFFFNKANFDLSFQWKRHLTNTRIQNMGGQGDI